MLLKKLFKKRETQAKTAPILDPLIAPLTMREDAKDAIFRAQPAHIQRFLTVLDRIVRDAILVGEAQRRGAALPKVAGDPGGDPIYCQGIKALFETQAADGSTRYRIYHYTSDLKSLDPNAQLHLSRFFGRIIDVNALLAHPGPDVAAAVAPLLDRILVEALYFTGFFSGFAVTRELLGTPNPDSTVLAQFQALVARTKLDLFEVSRYLHDAPAAFDAMPMTKQLLIVEVTKRYEDGQVVINGVHLDAAMGAQILAGAQQRHAKTQTA